MDPDDQRTRTQAQTALTAALATLHQAAGPPVPDGPPDATAAQQHAARLARRK